ncbi:MAG: amidase [Hyphomicrobiaceae bacterium]
MTSSQKSSALSRTKAALERIRDTNAETSIFIATRDAEASADAEAADRRCAKGARLSAVDGLLVAVKGNLAIAGLAHTMGFGCFRGRLAQCDAHAVAQLKRAGAIILGTLNMHEGALGATTDNPFFGQCKNPRYLGLTPGGSSGGSAAAVAAGLVDATLGTDTMGSVRLPAAYCGVVGFKPSYGVIGRSGLGQLSPSLDTIGPLGVSVATVRRIFETLLAPDPSDSEWVGLQAAATGTPVVLTELRLAIPKQLTRVPVEASVAGAFSRVIQVLSDSGVAISDVDMDGWNPSRSRRAGLLVTETEAALLLPDLLEPKRDGVSDEFKDMLRFGRDVAEEKRIAAYQHVRRAGAAFERVVCCCDAIIVPTAPHAPFPLNFRPPDNQADLTALANFAAAPAISLPMATAKDKPVAGLQIMAARGTDRRLLEIAAVVEDLLSEQDF